MKKLNTKGFTAIEGLLILVIVGIIGGAGYYVYKSQKDTEDTSNSTGNSEVTIDKNEVDKETSKEATDLTAGWKTGEIGTTGLSFKYPPKWSLEKLGENIKVTSNEEENGAQVAVLWQPNATLSYTGKGVEIVEVQNINLKNPLNSLKLIFFQPSAQAGVSIALSDESVKTGNYTTQTFFTSPNGVKVDGTAGYYQLGGPGVQKNLPSVKQDSQMQLAIEILKSLSY